MAFIIPYMILFAYNALRIVNNVLHRIYVQNVIMGIYCIIIINGRILA
jgi:hypothetical protein